MSSLLSAAASLLLAGGAGTDGAEGRSFPIREGRELTLDVPCTAGALIRGSVEPDHQAVVVRFATRRASCSPRSATPSCSTSPCRSPDCPRAPASACSP